MEEVSEMSYYNNVDFVCMDASPLADSLRQEGREWIIGYGKLLHEIAKTNLQTIEYRLDKFSDDLITDPSDLEDLKSVLQVRC